MSGDSIECYNCGRANPSWAQVCRSCGVPLQPLSGSPGGRSAGPVPTDQASLISVGLAIGSIAAAILIGVVLSGIIPDAPANPDVSLTPVPSAAGEPTPSPTPVPSKKARGQATGSARPSRAALPGTVTFGTALDSDTMQVSGQTNTFSSGETFAHSVHLSEPFGVPAILEDVIHIGSDGSRTVVQDKESLEIDPAVDTVGFATTVDALQGWGDGRFILRVYRQTGEDVELLAQGQFQIQP